MLSKDKIDSPVIAQKNSRVILPEELLLNSLLLFEDESAEEETAGLPAKEGGPEPAGSFDFPAPGGTAAGSEREIGKAILELEKEDTGNYYQKVKKELADYLKERQVIVEEVRDKLLAKAKSAKQRNCLGHREFKIKTKFGFKQSEQDSGFNSGSIIAKKGKSLELNPPQESKKTTFQKKSKLNSPRENKKTALLKSSKQGNLLTAENPMAVADKAGPQRKTSKSFKRQKVKISKLNDQLRQRTGNVNIGAVVFNPVNKSGLNNKSLEKTSTAGILPAGILPKSTLVQRISLERSKSISPRLRIKIKPLRNEDRQIKLTEKEKPCALPRKDLKLKAIKQGSDMTLPVDQFDKPEHFLIDKGILNRGYCLNRGDRLDSRDQENKLSLQDRGKGDLRFKQLSLSGEKRNSGGLFKL